MTANITTTTVKKSSSDSFGEIPAEDVTVTSPPIPLKVDAEAQTIAVKIARAALRYRKMKDIERAHMATDDDLRAI